MRNKNLVMGAILLATTLLPTGCGSSLPSNTLVVGLECDYAPFNWTQTTENDYTLPIYKQSNQYADGYDIQIARYLGNELSYDIRIVKTSWDALIPSLQANQINVIIAGMSPTKTRLEQIDFSNPYYVSDCVGLVRVDSAYTEVTSINELSGASVISQLGTVQDSVIDQISGVNHLTGTDTYGNAVLRVVAGTADCCIVEKPVAMGMVQNYDNLKMIEFTNGNFTGLTDGDISVSVGLNKGNDDLATKINEALAKLTTSDRDEMMNAAITRNTALSD